MSDGAVFTLKEVKREGKYWSPDLDEVMKHLLSNDPNEFWTSG